jgi:hypothetical protein
VRAGVVIWVVTSALGACDVTDGTETVVATRAAATGRLDARVAADGAFATNSLAVTVLLGAALSVTAGLPLTPADVEDGPGPGAVRCLRPRDALEPPDVLEPACAPLVRTTVLGVADVVVPVDVGAPAIAEEAAGVCVGFEAETAWFAPTDAPLFAVPLEPELDGEFELLDDGPTAPGSAHATPYPVKTAAPTPSAIASPPTRPIYLEAPMTSPWRRPPGLRRTLSPSPGCP